MTAKEFDLDIKSMMALLGTILVDITFSTFITGLTSFIASVLGIIYLFHRITKIKIEVKQAKLDVQMRQLECEAMIKKSKNE